MRIDVYHHGAGDSGKLEYLIKKALRRLEAIMAQLDVLQAEVAENTTVVQSAITLIDGLAQQIRDLEPTQEAIDALAAELDATSNALADAVAANTPAEEEPEPEPEV